MIPKYRVIKLDKRHTCYQYFKYYIEPFQGNPGERLVRYHEYRMWCWSTFGPSMEREFMVTDDFKWCWYTHHSIYRLYLQSEKELNWFKLTWSTT